MIRSDLRPVFAAALLGAAAALTPSCQSPAAATAPLPALPAAWHHAAGFPVANPQQDLAAWWTGFNDPLLTRVIGGALEGNPDLASVAARVREARAQRKGQAAVLLPAVDASASGRSSWTHVDGLPDDSGHSYAAGVSASWDADLFGGNRQLVAAAAASEAVARENFASAQASLAAEAALAYVDLRAAESKLAVLRENLKTREETTRVARWRTQAGEMDALELRQAEASLQQAQAALPSLEQIIARTKNRLALLSGKPCGALDALLAGGTGRIPVPGSQLAAGIPADTVRQRPDVRAAGYQWVAAVARTRAAEAEKLPSLRLSGSLGINSLTAAKLFNPQSAGASIIGGLTSPVFDAGRIRAAIESKDAAQEQALLGYQAAVLEALSGVEDELIVCRRSAERLAILEKASVAAREADSLARLRYRTGDSDLLTVLETQRTSLSIEDSLISIRADRVAACIRLYKALGGGWSRS